MAGEGRGNVEEEDGCRGRDKVQWQEKEEEIEKGKKESGRKREGGRGERGRRWAEEGGNASILAEYRRGESLSLISQHLA